MGCAGVGRAENVGDNNTPITRKCGAVRIPADRVGSDSHLYPVAVTLSASHGSGGLSAGRLSRSLRWVSRSPRFACRLPLAFRTVRLRRVGDGLKLIDISI